MSVEADAAVQGLALVRAALAGHDAEMDRHLVLPVVEYLTGLVAELLEQAARKNGVAPEVLLDRLSAWQLLSEAGMR